MLIWRNISDIGAKKERAPSGGGMSESLVVVLQQYTEYQFSRKKYCVTGNIKKQIHADLKVHILCGSQEHGNVCGSLRQIHSEAVNSLSRPLRSSKVLSTKACDLQKKSK